jgi:hypothetical protein
MAPGDVSTHLIAELLPDVRAISIADHGLGYATVVAGREIPFGPDAAFN